MHRGQNWAQDDGRGGKRCSVGSEGHGKLCEWRDRRHRHPGQGLLRLAVWGRMKEVELMVLAWRCRRDSDVMCN